MFLLNHLIWLKKNVCFQKVANQIHIQNTDYHHLIFIDRTRMALINCLAFSCSSSEAWEISVIHISIIIWENHIGMIIIWEINRRIIKTSRILLQVNWTILFWMLNVERDNERGGDVKPRLPAKKKKKKHEDEFQTVNHLIQRPKGMSKWFPCRARMNIQYVYSTSI